MIGCLLFSISAFAQGTLSFNVFATGLGAVPPNASPREGTGFFTLDESHFLVAVFEVHEAGTGTDTVALFRADAPNAVGAQIGLFTLGRFNPPDGGLGIRGGQDYDFSRTLSALERDDLLAGKWYVAVLTDGFPSGEIRGQVTVPEPATTACLAIGGLIFLLRSKSTEAGS